MDSNLILIELGHTGSQSQTLGCQGANPVRARQMDPTFDLRAVERTDGQHYVVGEDKRNIRAFLKHRIGGAYDL